MTISIIFFKKKKYLIIFLTSLYTSGSSWFLRKLNELQISIDFKSSSQHIFTLFFLRFYLFVFKERGREREREGGKQHAREMLIGCLLQVPSQGPGLQPRHGPWPEIKQVTFWFAGWCSTHWAMPGQGHSLILSSVPHSLTHTLWRLYYYWLNEISCQGCSTLGLICYSWCWLVLRLVARWLGQFHGSHTEKEMQREERPSFIMSLF